MRSRSATLWIFFRLGACGRSGLWHGVAGTGGVTQDDGVGNTGVASTATIVDCGSLASPSSGSVSASSTTDGAAATYSCFAGYALTGSAIRICQQNGMWSGTAPSCAVSNCPSGETECNAVCLDAQADNNNCGFCGNVCSALSPSRAQCTAGRCLVTLATGMGRPQSIAADATSVYWTNYYDGTVMKVFSAGGTPTTLASGQSRPTGIAVDATSVYWISDDTVKKVSVRGGTPTTLVSGRSFPQGLAVDATSVYWTEYGYQVGPVMKVPLGGGTPITLASGQSYSTGIVVEASSVYWTNNAIWGNSDFEDDSGSVMKVALSGGTPTTLASGLPGPCGIAVDATSVFWIDQQGGGAVMKVPRGGGTPTTLASGQSAPGGIVVDATSVYWTNGVNGTVMRLSPKW